ncbi:nuclear transport factor 2 family protein [Streptomyces sp. OUCMDZ-3434]|uniref:nuclear transport factor 2 family protein n=1 Tax=Streptomyces sp. OUCMDZ-3434 TaxID=1535304 RepID=UPI001E42E304|nr:nuclear transport factor 2 family protein [Streptomyces sp. OUCMDZ-3434]
MDTERTDPVERMLAERECERLIVEFGRRLDLGDPADVAELCTEDAVWEWPAGERRIEGREGLRAYFAGRPSDRLSRRVASNILVTVTSPDTATATSYFTTYRVDGHTSPPCPSPATVSTATGTTPSPPSARWTRRPPSAHRARPWRTDRPAARGVRYRTRN